LRTHGKKDAGFYKAFTGLQLDWCTEMYAYIFAAAEAGVRHRVLYDLQIRDVDDRRDDEYTAKVPMIHMGRAWMPPSYKPGWKWHHTEGEAFSEYGNQVWCKCNFTASDILPWPIPPGTDFQSRVTLQLLHDAREKWGPLPENTNFRR